MAVHTRAEDGSVIDETGKVVYFSVDRFLNDICLGDCCFICGVSPETVPFNNEHVLPFWLLKRYDLFARHVTLPNFTEFTYGQYVIPCCKTCNSLLGRKVENPVQKLIEAGFDAVATHLRRHGNLLFFVWQSLIYLKTHLKDKSLRMHRDRRKGDELISDMYEWQRLHHIHCIARSVYTRPLIKKEVFGSFFLGPARVESGLESFDYGDLYVAGSTFLRVDDMFLVSVLDDSNAGLSYQMDRLIRKIDGPLSPLQIREVFAHLSYINMRLSPRPMFSSEFGASRYRIVCSRPEQINLDGATNEEFGELLYSCTAPILRAMANEDIDEVQKRVRSGDLTFLFDDRGEFIRNSMVRKPASPTQGE